MYLGYVDASGVPDRRDLLNYTLGCVVIHEEDWQNFESAIRVIKQNHFPDLQESDVEFHTKEMTGPFGIYSSMSPQNIYSIFDDIFDLISAPATPFP